MLRGQKWGPPLCLAGPAEKTGKVWRWAERAEVWPVAQPAMAPLTRGRGAGAGEGGTRKRAALSPFS